VHMANGRKDPAAQSQAMTEAQPKEAKIWTHSQKRVQAWQHTCRTLRLDLLAQGGSDCRAAPG